MTIMAIASLALGVVCGRWLLSGGDAMLLGSLADYALALLTLSVGVSVGGNRMVPRRLRERGLRILTIPAAVIAASVLGGYISGLLLGMEPNVSMAVAAGMGWGSLSGAMLTELAGARMGTLAFLSSTLREILAFLLIPAIARHMNPYAAIAPAGATSEDTALPLIMRYTGEEVAVVSVVNGILCSLAVPFLIEILFHLGAGR